MTTTPAPQGATTSVDDYARVCVNSYGEESGPHGGLSGGLVAVQLYAGRGDERRAVGERIGPLCPWHAAYEVRWRAAANMIALGEVEPYNQPEPVEG
jgi:hypothetical protein